MGDPATEKPTPTIELAKSLAREGNANVVNGILSECSDVPKSERLRILASAYDRKAEISDNMAKTADPEARDAYFVPPWGLEGIGHRAVAQHLREQAVKLDVSQPATTPKK